jgi:hypothetical protein
VGPTRRLLRQAGFTFLLAAFCWAVFSWPYWSRPENRAPGFMFAYHFLVWLVVILLLFVLGAGLGGKEPADGTKPPEAS